MDLARIKNLVRNGGDRFIIVENGEPEVVVLSFLDYERMVNGGAKNAPNHNETEEDIQGSNLAHNRKTDSSPEEEWQFPEIHAADSTDMPFRVEDIKLEDLPI